MIAVYFQRAAIGTLVLALVAPACAGRSISRDKDEDDDGRTVPDDDNDDDGNPPVPDDDDDSPGTPSSGGAGGSIGVSGGAFPTGGTIATGGQPSAGVGNVPSGGVSSGGAGPAGAGGYNTDPVCRGVRLDAGCMVEGYDCSNMVCGIADSGRRACSCAMTVWMCSACDYTNSPFRDRPPMIPPCVSGTASESPCTAPNFVCGPLADGDYCACYESPTDGLVWDCDSAPSTWSLR